MARIRIVDTGGRDGAQVAKVVGLVFAVLLGLIILTGSFFQVDSEEQGVVTRFGRFTRTASPGLHFKVPLVERVELVPTLRVLKEEFGLATDRRVSSRELRDESLMLTGDLNAAEVQWIVQYKIVDPAKYLFNVRLPRDTVRDVSEAVMRTAVGDYSVLEVMTEGRLEVAEIAREKMQEVLDLYESGMRIERVQFQTVGPPNEEVGAAFEEVNQAEQARSRAVDIAMTQYNEKKFKAEGEADRAIEGSRGYLIERVNRAKGEVARFESLLVEYKVAPEITRRRLYLEAMAEILPEVRSRILIDDSLKSALPLLHLGGSDGGMPR